jgi:hypothetical protein
MADRKQTTPADTPPPPQTRAEKRELSRADQLAKQMLKVGLSDDPAVVAAAIVIFATENIKRSAKTLPEARAYLDATRAAIDGLLLNAFPPKGEDASNDEAGG